MIRNNAADSGTAVDGSMAISAKSCESSLPGDVAQAETVQPLKMSRQSVSSRAEIQARQLKEVRRFGRKAGLGFAVMFVAVAAFSFLVDPYVIWMRPERPLP